MSTTSLFRSAAFRAALLCALLSACGGGGDPSAADPPAPPPVVAPPAPSPATSAYLLYDDKLELCKIDSGGALVDCSVAGDTGLPVPFAMTIAGPHAYIVGVDQDDSARMMRCDIGSNGALSECVDTGVGALESSYGLTAHDSNLYITSYVAPLVRKCPIKADGSLDDCADANFPGEDLADAVEDVRIVSSTAYVLNYGQGKVSKCAVLDDGTFSDCEDLDLGDWGLEEPKGLVISGNRVYIASANQIISCIIADDDGSLEGCESVVQGLGYATQVAVDGSRVYITDGVSTSGVIRCTPTSGGVLISCTSVRENGPVKSIVLR